LNQEPILAGRLSMTHIGQIALLIIVLTTMLIVLISFSSHFSKNKPFRYLLIFTLFFISTALLNYCYRLSDKAAENFLGASDLELHATVSQQLIMKTIVTNTGDQQIEISGNNSLGVIIWSLQNDSRIKLNEIIEHTPTIDTFLLTGIMKRFPVLILTRGY
jgi:hypothetical protein